MRIRLLIPAAAALCALAACKDQKEIEITEQDCAYMREAIRLASESVENGGGPFGAVIVKDGKIIAGRSNSVTIDNDPMLHLLPGRRPPGNHLRRGPHAPYQRGQVRRLPPVPPGLPDRSHQPGETH